MPNLVETVLALPEDQRTVVLDVLDMCTRPLTPREIEHALRAHGVPKSRATMFGNVLRKLAIVAVVGENKRG